MLALRQYSGLLSVIATRLRQLRIADCYGGDAAKQFQRAAVIEVERSALISNDAE